MKKSLKNYIEIFLGLLIGVGLFMPYVFDLIPMEFIFSDEIDFLVAFLVIIPILVIIPFLLILIFKDLLKNSLLKILKAFFLLLYLIVFGVYCYVCYDSFGSIFGGTLEAFIAIVLSLILILLGLKYSIQKSVQLQNIILAIMALPFILYCLEGIQYWEFNYGGYIINISFFLLYIIAVYNIYRNHNIKKLINK